MTRVIIVATAILPLWWLLFWLERQSAKRQAKITRIAWWVIIVFASVTAVAVIASFFIDPDPLCQHLPEWWEQKGWPCGVAVHNLRGK